MTQDQIENNWEQNWGGGDYSYIYTKQDDSVFNVKYFGSQDDYTFISSHTYNKSDGSLLSWKLDVVNPQEQGVIQSTHWTHMTLVLKQKTSEENICPSTDDKSEGDNSPGFNFQYLVLLIPIIKMKKIIVKGNS